MTHETGKSMTRRLRDSRFVSRYFCGHGIDIGSGDDSLAHYASYFPLMQSVRSWDLPDGDAMLMEDLPLNTFDFVHSSHCLEHLASPTRALKRWIDITRPGGHIIIVVPDEDLYEQGFWPSPFNADHKWAFSIAKVAGQPHALSVVDLLLMMLPRIAVLKIELLDSGYIYGAPPHDQSLSIACEPAIEIILRKL